MMSRQTCLFLLCCLLFVPAIVFAQPDSGTLDDTLIPTVPGYIGIDSSDIPMPSDDDLDENDIPTPPDANGIDENDIPMPPDDTGIDENDIPMPPGWIPPATPMQEELIEYPITPNASATTPVQPTLTPDHSRITPGLYRRQHISTSMTGTCNTLGLGHNPDGGGAGVEIPLDSVCQSAAADLLLINDTDYALLQAPNLYGSERSSRELLYQNNATVGTFNTVSRVEVEIISSTQIEERHIYREEGGCTVETIYRYELVETNDAVCGVNQTVPDWFSTLVDDALMTPEPTLPVTPAATEDVPVPPGIYSVTWPMMVGSCDQSSQPAFSSASISYTGSGDMLLNAGGESYTLFSDGSGFYTYQQFAPVYFQLQVYPMGDFVQLTWGKLAGSGICNANGELRSGDMPAPTSLPPTPTPAAALDVPTASGAYSTGFEPMDCAGPVIDKLPDFANALLRPEGGSYVLDFGTGSYLLSNQGGYYSFTEIGGDGSMVMIGVTSLSPVSGSASYTYMAADGSTCFATLVFTAAS